MHNEELRTLLSDAEAACDRVIIAINIAHGPKELIDEFWIEDDGDDDNDDLDAGARPAWLIRLRRVGRQLNSIAERLRDARLGIDRELEER
jgi:hypothetical protein